MSPVLPRNGVMLASRIQVGSEPPTDRADLVLEGWAEGFMFGGLVVMAAITIANMKRGVLLHKLILLELCIGGWESFNIFFEPPIYGWWLSAATIVLHISSQIHSLVAWMKIKPFLSPRSSQAFLGTVLLVQPYWIVEIYATFSYFNSSNGSGLFRHTRPIEVLFRDPWWVAACGKLLWVIKDHYEISLRQVININPRFGVMLAAMVLSIVFVGLDILSVTGVFRNSSTVGVNPFWKLALVFKCLTDTVILDDFKTALDRLWTFRRGTLGIMSLSARLRRQQNQQQLSPQQLPRVSSDDGKTPSVNSQVHAEHASTLHSPAQEGEQRLEDPDVYELRPPPATLQLRPAD